MTSKCINTNFSIDLEAIYGVGDSSSFWRDVGLTLEANADFKSAGDFVNYFKISCALARGVEAQVRVVLLIDGIQPLRASHNETIQTHFLSALMRLRNINMVEGTILQSVIATGTFTHFLLPIPFYANERLSIPYFTEEDCINILQDFGRDHDLTFDSTFTGHVSFMTGGYVAAHGTEFY